MEFDMYRLLKRALALLEEIELVETTDAWFCPMCRKPNHTEDCVLNNLIKDLKKELS